MSINWTVRLKNKAFWLALIPSRLLLVQQLAAVCGFTLDLTALQEQLMGLAGTVFMGGSTFAITAAEPIVWLCAVLAVPGFILWGAAYPLYRYVQKRRAQEVQPLVEGKLDEMYEVCEKASRLLEA